MKIAKIAAILINELIKKKAQILEVQVCISRNIQMMLKKSQIFGYQLKKCLNILIKNNTIFSGSYR